MVIVSKSMESVLAGLSKAFLVWIPSAFSPKLFPTMADALANASTGIWDDAVMAQYVPDAVVERFKNCLVTGEPTPEADKVAIAEGMFTWARSLGAVSFAHWFFPMRGGSGAVGGQVGAHKADTLIDLD